MSAATAGFSVGDVVTTDEAYRFDEHRLMVKSGKDYYRPNRGEVTRVTQRSVYARWPGAMGVGTEVLRHRPQELINLSRRGEA